MVDLEISLKDNSIINYGVAFLWITMNALVNRPEFSALAG